MVAALMAREKKGPFSFWTSKPLDAVVVVFSFPIAFGGNKRKRSGIGWDRLGAFSHSLLASQACRIAPKGLNTLRGWPCVSPLPALVIEHYRA